ncbi:Crp/Fnr family transcriptional regulator [Emticicia sp. BO119]|uniref:Crp/Fnr family transcriptional regulator n=1 Tax=Emticicia sp. BO119 TaxID=2757768 RepID=UPI0015F06936|nr:Crp/Fnr family transcriptional regulator [Emticicia sp. BO119]MBA4852265.1 Crp/Fnr family transcriptional regulator [Emticicia sp. BO119]
MLPALENYLQFIQQIHPLSQESIEALVPFLVPKNFARKDFLVHQGNVSDELHFIVSGCVREYFEDANANEINTWFGFENAIAVSTYSFFSQKPSLTNIQALEDTETIVIKHEDLQKLFNQFHEIERLGRLLAEQYLVQIEEIKIILQTLSARQRYEYLLQNKPEFIKRIPLKYLASFLGIKLETLSRVRGQK